MSNKKVYLVNVTAQGISRVITFAANFGVFILIARLSGVELFGQYSYVLAFLGLFTAIVDFGTGATLAKDIAQVKENVGNYWGNFLILRLSTAIIIILISIIIAYYMRRDLFVSLMIGLLALPFLASRFFEPVFQVYQKPWFSFYPALCYSTTYFIITLVMLLLGMTLLPLITAFIAANIVYAAVAFGLVCLVLKPEFKPNWTVMKSILKISLPIGVSSLFAIANSKVAVFMLAAMKSDYAVAMYNAADRFLNPVVLMIITLVGPIIPIFSNKAENDIESLKRNFKKIIELSGLIGLPIATMVPLVSPWLVNAVFGPNFIQSAVILNIMAWTAILIFLSVFGSSALLAKGIVNFAYWNTACAVIFSIIFNYLWIPRYGIVGSALAAFICEVFLSGVTVYYIIKHFGNPFRLNKWTGIVAVNIILYFYLHSDLVSGKSAVFKIFTGFFLYLLTLFAWKMIRAIGVSNKIRYVTYFVYSKYLSLDFPAQSAQKYIRHQWNLPEGYIVGSPDSKTSLVEWAELLSQDDGFGEWTPEKIESEIIRHLIAPDAASLLFYRGHLIGCCSTERYLSPRGSAGMLMWLMMDPCHRKKKLSQVLVLRTMAYFAREGYDKIISFTETHRIAALRLYLSMGYKPRYNSIFSIFQWYKLKDIIREYKKEIHEGLLIKNEEVR